MVPILLLSCTPTVLRAAVVWSGEGRAVWRRGWAGGQSGGSDELCSARTPERVARAARRAAQLLPGTAPDAAATHVSQIWSDTLFPLQRMTTWPGCADSRRLSMSATAVRGRFPRAERQRWADGWICFSGLIDELPCMMVAPGSANFTPAKPRSDAWPALAGSMQLVRKYFSKK